MKHSGEVLVIVSVVMLIMSSCTPPTQPTAGDSIEQVDEQSDEQPDERELWEPEQLHAYTFPAELSREELSDEAIRESWEFSEATYTDMVRRVDVTVESHNLNNPDDELQVILGGL